MKRGSLAKTRPLKRCMYDFKEAKREKKRQKKEARKIPEDTRNRLQQTVDDFQKSNNEEYTFDAGLTNIERGEVHNIWTQLGMKSKSFGKGAKRRLTLYKIKANVKTRTKFKKPQAKRTTTCFKFSEEGKTVLRDFFSLYPPGDHKEAGKIAATSIKNTDNISMRNDDIFRKPVMEKAEIAKKVESDVARMQSNLKLKQITKNRSKLPIASFKDVITSTIESNQVVLICGETGCGKTTQVPQYLLDYMWSKGKACKIVCTQPRRISAVSVAERISVERDEPIGESVGYTIRLEKRGGRHSSIVFCTVGVLLRVLVNAGKQKSAKMVKSVFSDITHIIVDEIHERDRFSDFLLTVLRDRLSLYPHLRVVLMSATLDAERFSQYFGGCPVIRVPGFIYDVKKLYLEDVLMLVKSESTNARHLDGTLKTNSNKKSEMTEDYKLSLDEAINIAWSRDELDSLINIVAMGEGKGVCNYQHSVTGVTPLMVFARKGRISEIRMLLSFGANCHLQDNEGKTALSWAELADKKEASDILRKHLDTTTLDLNEGSLLVDRYLQDVNPELVDIILIEQLLRKICTESEEGAILVFLPGWHDINALRDKLKFSNLFRDSSKFLILVLHSMVPSIEQKKVFERPSDGRRKIVLSTNVAETSITIDDVVFVIDSGIAKEKSYDPFTRVSALKSSWISKASAKQREGRAGRCQPGICYHLYSKHWAASLMEFQVPEIKTTPIDELCLQVKLLDPSCKIQDFLKKTLDPPVSLAINNAITSLQSIGALSPNEELTELGEKLGSIPVHPLTSKMLTFAISMNCLDPALTLACANDFKDPFRMLFNHQTQVTAAKSELSSLYGSHGDQLAIVAAFESWKSAKQRGQEAWFCSKYFISASVMRMLSQMRIQLQHELHMNGFLPENSSRLNENSRNSGIINAVLVAGLYPLVGRLLPPDETARHHIIIESANTHKVQLSGHSLNFGLNFKKYVEPLVIYDEVGLTDAGLRIKKCSIIAPLPLLLLATEFAVAPINEEGNNNESEDQCMSNPDAVVKVIADRWLPFESTALDAAQICCLRERLSAAVMFKMTHPGKDLPEVLAASLDAIARVLSCDGLVGINGRAAQQ